MRDLTPLTFSAMNRSKALVRGKRLKHELSLTARQAADAEQIILADVQRHRVMKGYPPEGKIFEIGSGPKTREKLAKLKHCGQVLTKLLAQQHPLKVRQEGQVPTTGKS